MQAHRNSARVGAAVLVITLGAGAGVVYRLGGTKTSADRLAPYPRPLSAIFDPSQPLLIQGLKTSTIAQAAASLDYPLYAPSGAAPSEVWVSPTVDEAGIRFGSSLVLTFARWYPNADVTNVYRAEAQQWGIGYETLLSDHPSWVIPDHPGNPAPGVAAVHITIGNVEVVLYGEMPIDQLVPIAQSLNPA
jgi:hypothetical protein